jgi:hypothetical protein
MAVAGPRTAQNRLNMSIFVQYGKIDNMGYFPAWPP